MKPLLKRASRALIGPMPVSRDRAMGMAERLSAMTALTASAEHLARRRATRPGGLNDWAVNRDAYARRHPITRRVLDALADERVTTALHAGRVVAGAALLLPGSGRWRGAAGLFMGVGGAALYPRHRYGTDGSDQVSTLVQSAVGVARLSRRTTTQDALLWYVAVQSNLSYLVSGWMKLLGRDWRTGAALQGVMRTRTYGHHAVWRLTTRHPRAARAVVHGVLALECLFPVLYLRGGALTRPVVASAAAFHVANAFAMGLGRFATAFVSMHPIVAYTSAPAAHPAVVGRDDRFPASVAVAVAGAAGYCAVTALARRRRATATDGTTGSVTTRHGNVLRHTARLRDERSTPVAVFVPGLVATPHHFGWVTQTLIGDGDLDLVTYQRAGYGPSTRGADTPFTLRESVDDLVDLVDEVVPAGRPVLLVGHSLGSELARRAAPALGGRLHGIVYLDSSHPAELHRSEQQGTSAHLLRQDLTRFLNSLRVGLGSLLVRPAWVDDLPAPVREDAMAQYADTRLWNAGRREWHAVERDFRAHDGTLSPVDAHALVLSAQRTVDQDPEQLLMHRELAEAHRLPGRLVRVEVIEDCDHESLLTQARFGTDVGRRIVAFLADTATTTRPQEPATGEAPR
ncbi:alpha/beta fold hydrolase [Streptomyces sp. HSG2]|uniref:alpha/beta fold hydrolase n=1 Tax=Streptomyces sp. HSG2 TaxID=2797167 RepID=UPI001F5B10C5|nr:alpha/beta fold hydrolase [Streptomyces sp. HSG2]